MTIETSDNKYALLLKEQGSYVVRVEGIDWYDHSGYMIPAYLPHCVPQITSDLARKVVKISNRPFAKWDRQFGKLEDSEWWWVLRRKPWNIQDASRNTRSKIRRGMKKFITRVITLPEIRKYGYKLCLCAEQRYGRKGFVISKDKFNDKILAAEKYSDAFEFYGVFCEDKLVGFSENYIQNKAVFLESIWYDPSYLRSYSSYVFTQGVLEHYINQRNFEYVLDGWRSVHHKTNVQDFCIDVFGFVREYANLDIAYSPFFGSLVKAAYPFRKAFWKMIEHSNNKILNNISAVLKQEYIRQTCTKL